MRAMAAESRGLLRGGTHSRDPGDEGGKWEEKGPTRCGVDCGW